MHTNGGDITMNAHSHELRLRVFGVQAGYIRNTQGREGYIGDV